MRSAETALKKNGKNAISLTSHHAADTMQILSDLQVVKNANLMPAGVLNQIHAEMNIAAETVNVTNLIFTTTSTAYATMVMKALTVQLKQVNK